MSSPLLPSPFMYGDLPQGGVLAPMIITSRIPSNTIDKTYPSGYFWLSSLDQFHLNSAGQRVYGNGTLWIQAGNSAGVPGWEQITSALTTLAIPGATPLAANSVMSNKALASLNSATGAVTFTGFKTAPYGTQILKIENSQINEASQLLVSISNEGSNDAKMTLQRVKRFAGSFEVYVSNAGTAALNGNMTVVFQKIA